MKRGGDVGKVMKRKFVVAGAVVFLEFASHLPYFAQSLVTVLRTPNQGIQPQAGVDSKGIVHLIYYLGDPAGGDIFYVRRLPGQAEFSTPVRVNTRERSAMAMGTIRGAQLAIGEGDRVHVVWNGMGSGAQLVSVAGKEIAPLLYTRLKDGGSAFETERNLITFAAGLDGGSSVAAYRRGNVYVTWHAPSPGNTNEDAGRAVFVARSRDGGKTFEREVPATAKQTGACPCCGMRAFADQSGTAYMVFRGATEDSNRDALLLVSRQPGQEFQIAHDDRWKVTTCPMSSATITEAEGGALAAWETAGQVFWATVSSQTLSVSSPVRPPSQAGRKHPVAVRNQKGETLLAWTEGTAWAKGGMVAWQVWDGRGKPSLEQGRAEGLPAWGLVTACVSREGPFLIIY